MLICKTPFRISLFGGGTDFPHWYSNNKGMVISYTIDKYCYVTLRRLPNFFTSKYRLRYFKNEYKNKLIGKLRKHNLQKLSMQKPGLVEKKINNGTKKLFRSLEHITGAPPPTPIVK